MKLDDWQQKVMDTKGNIVLRSGRQVGKSTVVALKAAKHSIEHPNQVIMCIAFTEKQANLLFSKILNNIIQIEKKDKKKYISKPKPTKHVINLKNKTKIYCYAAGDTGYGIMGYTIDVLIADECAWIKPEVWRSLVPALAVTKGEQWLLSTPWLSEGYYYECFDDPTFTSFHYTSEQCDRITPEFLEEQKKRLTSQEYAQMYLGEFIDDFRRVFSDEWINSVCSLPSNNSKPFHHRGERFLGIDVAGMGEDESTFEGLYKQNDNLFQFHHETTTKTRTTETTDKILYLNRLHDYEKIGIDNGGLGVGVFDQLLLHDDTRHKIVPLNNSVKIEIDKEGRTQNHKEAMYANLVGMGERGEIKLFDEQDIRDSLRSITVEEGGRITGRYSHIVEGLIRAAWLGKEKDLNPTIYTIKV